MSTPHPAAPPAYAVLRVDRRKAKAMAAIAAASAHQLREKPTPNADPDGPAPVALFLAAGSTPYQAARHLLDGAERRNRDTVLCREVVLSASPGHFRPGREQAGGAFDPARVKAWVSVALAWAKRQWPDQLASACLHLDEMTPHMHLLVVPRVRTREGAWKLNSKALFDRERLRDLQTGYGAALGPLGIKRGRAGEQGQAQRSGAVLWRRPRGREDAPAGHGATGTQGTGSAARNRRQAGRRLGLGAGDRHGAPAAHDGSSGSHGPVARAGQGGEGAGPRRLVNHASTGGCPPAAPASRLSTARPCTSAHTVNASAASWPPDGLI